MERAEKIVKRVLAHYKMSHPPRMGDPFKGLVRTILSQNTSRGNTQAAYNRLETLIGVEPNEVAKASLEEIADAIKPAGIHHQRAKTLKRVAELVLERYGGDMRSLLKRPYVEARRELMELPGVGRKTADVVLLFEAGMRVLPIDRHIYRIAMRLGLTRRGADYDEVRRVLEEASSPERYLDLHLNLIRLGREICKARRPRCEACFLLDLCLRIDIPHSPPARHSREQPRYR